MPEAKAQSRRHVMRGGAAVIVLALLLPTSGCSSGLSKYRTPERMEHGYIIVLPGIEGRSFFNANIVKGLAAGGVQSAIEVYDWTAGGPLLFPVNLRAWDRNKRQARKIADKIIDYQDRYPGRPVHLVGHSGGGGLAVLAVEALPPTRRISGAILLAPALSPTYDLSRALRRSGSGFWNFYSPYDVGFLRAGTTVFGNIDGEHSSSAGAVAFTPPWGMGEEDRRLYRSKLHQQRYTHAMSASGHGGGHFGWADHEFVKDWLAPLIHSQDEGQTHYASDATAYEQIAKPPVRSSEQEATQMP